MSLLNHYGIVRINGDDAPKFIQSQFTNDINEVSEKKFKYGAYLTPKGRVFANFLMFKANNDYLLALSSSLVEPTVKRLKQFVLRAKVEIEAATELNFVAMVDAEIPGVISSYFVKNYSKDENTACILDGKLCFRMPGNTPRIGFIVDKSEPKTDIEPPFGIWQRIDIESGIPLVELNTSEHFVPQALNLDLIDNAVCFTKGCFPGQEIAARLHYRGGVNRRMLRASISTTQVPAPGTMIQCKSLNSDQKGTVVNAAMLESETECQLLISVPLVFLQHQDFEIEHFGIVKILQDALPYEIPEI